MMTLRAGITGGVLLLGLLAMGIVSLSDNIWYPLIQMATFTILIVGVTPVLKGSVPLFQYISEDPIRALMVAGILVLFITFIQSLLSDNEKFIGGSQPLCPPKLDFNFEKGLDSDTERQTPACISDANKLTEEEELDKIDIYLRDTQESIARITGYLNIARPDERWMSKREMDDPNNVKL